MYFFGVFKIKLNRHELNKFGIGKIIQNLVLNLEDGYRSLLKIINIR